MNKILTAGMAALTLAGGALTTATPAAARDWNGYHGGYYRGDRGDDAGAAIAGGIVGLALGASLASHNGGPYYGGSYYGPAYGPGYYGPGYGGTCVSHRSVWDGYRGRYVLRTIRYAC